MYHSITIGRGLFKQDKTFDERIFKNTYDDWKIVPKSRPEISPPKPKTNYVDIPGSNGSIDLSEAVSPGPIYDNRDGSWDFYVLNDYPTYKDWIDIYNKIVNFIHGYQVTVRLEDDPNYEYTGRLAMKDWKSAKDWSSVSIDYTLNPFKVNANRVIEFDVTDGQDIFLGPEDVGIKNEPVSILITTENIGPVTINSFTGAQDSFTGEFNSNQQYSDTGVIFGGGFAKLNFSGSVLESGGHVSITYKDARL